MIIAADRLRSLVARIFAGAGCCEEEANRIGHYLVESNLVGHDSHGVIRVSQYIGWMRADKVYPNRDPQVVFETDSFVVIDGQFGFGQTMGEFATKQGIAKCQKHGVAIVALRQSGHLGRIGDWPRMAALEGLVSLHFVSTSGFGLLVAPHGGIDRRLSANPIAVGAPRPGQSPILLDMSTCSIAEGKIKVALNKGASVPEGCIIDSDGNPIIDPKLFYAQPPGAILPMAGHKGFGLGLITEILAQAFTDDGCSDPQASRLSNGMLSIFLDPNVIPRQSLFSDDIDRLVNFVKGSRLADPQGSIRVPGELEESNKAQRLAHGIELDPSTWNQLLETARSLSIELE